MKNNNKNINIPKLRFPEFVGEWETIPLIELSENGFNNGAFNDPKRVGSGYRIINVKDMYINDTIDVNLLTLIDLEEKEFKNNKAEYGDIFFTRSSLVKEGIAYSNVNISYNNDLTFDGHLIRMRPKKTISNSLFLSYNFKTNAVRGQLIVRGKTTTMTTIGQEDMASVSISLPPLPEQEKIANFLTSIDTKLQALKKKKDLLEKYKKGIMQKLFSVKTDGRASLRFKDENGNDFPDWEVKKLGEVCEVQGGFAFKSSKFKETGIPIIRISNISNNNNFIDVSNMVYYEKIQSDQNYIIKNGDLLIAMSGATTGKTSVFNLNEFAYVNQRVGLFKSLTENLFYPFIAQFVIYDEFEKQLNSLLVAGAQPNISSNDIESIKVPFPHNGEQEKIANFLTAIDTKIEQTNKKIEQTQTFKKGLLQQMFV